MRDFLMNNWCSHWDSGVEIVIFNYRNFDIREFVNKKIEHLLTSRIDEDPPGFLIEGKFIGKIYLHDSNI